MHLRAFGGHVIRLPRGCKGRHIRVHTASTLRHGQQLLWGGCRGRQAEQHHAPAEGIQQRLAGSKALSVWPLGRHAPSYGVCRS